MIPYKKCETLFIRTGPDLSKQLVLDTSNSGNTMRAHRAVYLSTWGELPEHIFVGHRCDRKECVNPMHLYPCTAKEDTAAIRVMGQKKGKQVFEFPMADGNKVHAIHGPKNRKDVERAALIAALNGRIHGSSPAQ